MGKEIGNGMPNLTVDASGEQSKLCIEPKTGSFKTKTQNRGEKAALSG